MDCPICLESISNIHALICGHLYCGPPRTCLNALKHDHGNSTKCAVCNNVMPYKTSQLKPLYGLQDALNEIDDEANYRKKAMGIVPLLEDIDSALVKTDSEIETLMDKKLKLEQLKEYKAIINQVVDRKKPLSSDLKQLFDSDWFQTIDIDSKTLKAFNFAATIANAKGVKTTNLTSNKHLFKGFLFSVKIFYEILDGEEWIGAYLSCETEKTEPNYLEARSEFQLVLLNSNPIKHVKFNPSPGQGTIWSWGKKFLRRIYIERRIHSVRSLR